MASTMLTLTDSPSAETQSVISDRLDAFNERHTGRVHSRPLAVVLTDHEGEVVGGLLGHTSLGLLFIDLLFVPASLRGAGVGSEMLRIAEGEAVGRGCRQALVYTITFQAPEFYQRHGYVVFGEVCSGPRDQARLFLTKALDEAAD